MNPAFLSKLYVGLLAPLSMSIAISPAFALERSLTPAERSAAQQLVDNQWITITDHLNRKGNLVADAIQSKNPSWIITNAKQLAEQFKKNPTEAFKDYRDKPILIFSTVSSVDKGPAPSETSIELNAGSGQESIKALPETAEDRAYILERESGWFEVLLCKRIANPNPLVLSDCSPKGTAFEKAIDEADEAVLEALKGKGKTANAIKAAVVAFEAARLYPKGPLSFETGPEYGKAVENVSNALTFETNPQKFLEIATELGYSKDFLQDLFH